MFRYILSFIFICLFVSCSGDLSVVKMNSRDIVDPPGDGEVAAHLTVNGKAFFPIMQWLQDPGLIPQQRSVGFNTYMGNGGNTSDQSYLDTCLANGKLGAIAYDSSLRNLASHKALLAWFYGDEPDLGDAAPQAYPSEVKAMYDEVKSFDPNHYVFLTVTANFASRFSPSAWMNGTKDWYRQYAAATDFYGFDDYPVYGWCQPGLIGEISNFGEDFATNYAMGKPTYQWIEAVHTSSQWCNLTPRFTGDLGGPLPEEIRNEVWQAIIHGAKGIGYFTHSWSCPEAGGGYSQYCVSPAQEQIMTKTNQQITNLTDVILLGSNFTGAVALSGATAANIHIMGKEMASAIYIFVVNTSRSTLTPSFTLSTTGRLGPVQVIDEARQINLNGTTFTDTFNSLGDHIYRIEKL